MTLKSIEIKELFGKYNYKFSLNEKEKIKILFGMNGLGKTTILELISHLSDGDLLKILNIPFKELKLTIFNETNSKDSKISINKESYEIATKAELIFNKFNYNFDKEDYHFFENIPYQLGIDTLKSCKKKIQEHSKLDEGLLIFIYPEKFRNEIQNCNFLINIYEEMKSIKCLYITTQRVDLEKKIWDQLIIDLNAKSIPDHKKIYNFRKSITQYHTNFNFDQISLDFLKKGALSLAVKQKAKKLTHILKSNSNNITEAEKSYFELTITNFLNDKILKIDEKLGFIIQDFSSKIIPLECLSSGELNLILIFFGIIFETLSGDLILIDEPEISLHTVWQLRFIKSLIKIQQIKPLNFLISTHSAEIIDDRLDLCYELGRFDE